MASLNNSGDALNSNTNSPTHPMVLRSACRKCQCVTTSEATQYAKNAGNEQKWHVKDHFHAHQSNHHHHHHSYKELITKQQRNNKKSKSVQLTLTPLLANHQCSNHTQNNSFKAHASIINSGKVEQNLASKLLASSVPGSVITSTKASTISAERRAVETIRTTTTSHVHKSDVERTAFSSNKRSYSDYSSGNEGSGFEEELTNQIFSVGDNFTNQTNNLYKDSIMSRTQIRNRGSLSSARVLSATESDSDESSPLTVSFLKGRRKIGRAREKIQSQEATSSHVWAQDFNKSAYNYPNNNSDNDPNLYNTSAYFHKQSHQFTDLDQPLQEKMSHSSSQSFSKSSVPPVLPFFSEFLLTAWIMKIVRWLLWKCVYHNICRILLLDTWILSRTSAFGKKKLLFLLLLPLLLYLLLGVLSNKENTQLYSPLHALKSGSSAISLFFMSMFSSIWHKENQKDIDSIPVCKEVPVIQDDTWSYIWNLVVGAKKEATDSNSDTTNEIKTFSSNTDDFRMNKEQMKSVAQEVFKQEADLLLLQISTKNRMDASVEKSNEDITVLQNKMGTLDSQYQYLTESLKLLRTDINDQYKRSKDVKEASMSEASEIQQLGMRLKDLEKRIQVMENLLISAKNCCKNHSEYVAMIDSHLSTLLKSVMEDQHEGMFGSWLRSTFVSELNLRDQISKMNLKIDTESSEKSRQQSKIVSEVLAIKLAIEKLKQQFTEDKSTSSSSHQANVEYLSHSDIQEIVRKAILLYDADKIGLVDYALESGGGSVVSTRCSETYNAGTARLSVFGIPLWYISNSPRTAIQPDIHPGQCWAFKGSHGFLVLQLSATIQPTAFSLEHIPKSLSPTGSIDSAPKDISVWGLSSEKDNDGKLLGEYTYDKDGDPLQYFAVQVTEPGYFSFIELKILSNHGNQEYTCLYRFRVHGSRL